VPVVKFAGIVIWLWIWLEGVMLFLVFFVHSALHAEWVLFFAQSAFFIFYFYFYFFTVGVDSSAMR
jgi:hypothetical protein